MFRRFSNEDSVRSREELIEMVNEDILIELFEAFILAFTVISEAINSFLSSNGFGATLIDEGDSVLHSEEIYRSDVVFIHRGTDPFCDLGIVTPCIAESFCKKSHLKT